MIHGPNPGRAPRRAARALRDALGAAALLGVATGCSGEPEEPARLTDRPPIAATAEMTRMTRDIAERASEAIGLRLSGGLRLQSVDSDATGVLFAFAMENQKEAPPPPGEAALREARTALAGDACPASTTLERALLREGGALRYRYLTAGGAPVHELELRLEDCEPYFREAAPEPESKAPPPVDMLGAGAVSASDAETAPASAPIGDAAPAEATGAETPQAENDKL